MSKTTREKIALLQQLLEVERQADLEQYRKMVLSRSLQDRIKQGVTWYPVQLRHVGVGLGERVVLHLEWPEGSKKKGGTFQVGTVVAVFGKMADRESGRITGVISRMREDHMHVMLNVEYLPDWAVFGKMADRESGRITGVISRMREDHMHVMLNVEYLPDWAVDSTLGIDLEFDDRTYQEMQHALSQVLMPPKKNARIAELREILIGERAPEFHEWNIDFVNDRLNPSQNRAVQRILKAQDVAIIHGPPGTGKTTTLVEAIKETALHEHQVLVCAPSNTAVDLLTLKCLEAGLEVLRLGNPARVDDELLTHTLDGSIMAHPDYQALRKLRKDAEDARKRAAKHKRKYGARERQQRSDLFREARELKAMAHKLEDYIVYQLVNHTPVITCTLTGASAKVLGNKRFHTVFIDEAGQALEPSCWIPILRSNRVIMAGDHCQLPPTVKSQEADRRGLSHTLFEQVMENKSVDVMLEQQYRMNEQIMRFSGQQFYHNQLFADASVRDHLVGPNFAPVTFVDTAGCGFSESKNPQTLSTGNSEEANLVLLHLALLFNQIENEAPDALTPTFRVGIITPYKEQVRLLKKQLRNSPMLSSFESYVDINTVDGFQGQEREVVYISLVRSNTKNKIGFLADIRRMNVALTRARKKLVVIGDSSTLGEHPFYRDFLDYIDQLGAYHSAFEYLAEG